MFNRSLFVCAALALFAASPLNAQSHPAGLCKAGLKVLPTGSPGATVSFPVAWPAATTYSVALQQVNAGGYSGTPACTYFNVLNPTATSFGIQHKQCDTGQAKNVTSNVSLFWIACPFQ
jgi:hypothetical protein